MAATEQMASGYWFATMIGGLVLAAFCATVVAEIRRAYRRHRNGTLRLDSVKLAGFLVSDNGGRLWRHQILIREALIVRQRLSGAIDTETYQARMNDLVRQTISERRPQRRT